MVDGIRIPLKRSALEDFVLQKYCQDQVTIEAFAELYNEFLEEQGIPLSSDLYCTAAHLHSRANKFATTSRIVLYTPSRHLRYYDIDAKDYTKLLDKLNLWSYRDVELSTAKFMRQHPKLMAQYDIRNQYELHNLLKKIIPEGSYYDFHCKRSPTIAFGNFDRDEMILNLLINHAPITTADLIDLIHKEYGDSKDQIHNKYLQNFQQYHHNGVYTIDKKAMPSAHMELLRAALTEDFYFFYEIKRIYRELIPDADPEMVNPYTLKSMGLLVLSDYVLQNHASLDAYFKHLMTKSDIVELAPLKKRFGSITMWHGALFSMKQNYQIIEFEPDRSISLQKLERSGVTKQMLTDFCDEVYRYVESDTYFTVKSLNQCGFTAPLYELGFQEWFYANILCQDARFSSQKTLGTIVLFKGNTEVSIRSFVIDQIRRKGMIDVIDLLNLLQEFFGCNAATVHIIKEKIRDTEIFYDPILDRLYANAELYYKELEEDAEEL